MIPASESISFHSILVNVINGAAVGLGINISMVAFFSLIRKLIQFYQQIRDRNKITNVPK